MYGGRICCFTDCTKPASAAALIHRQQTLYWLFTLTKLSSIAASTEINLLSLIYVLGVDETRSVTYNLGETQTCNNFFFYFPVARSSKACGKRRKTLKSWRRIYPSRFLLCHGKAVNLLHLWNFKLRNVRFEVAEHNLVSDIKLDIPKFDTALLHSNWSN